MARKLRNGILILLAAAVLAFALWMLWPRSLTGTLGLEGREISASIVTTGWEEVRDEGNFYNRPTMDMERYTLPAGSEQAEAIRDLLDQYTYHFCWDTLADPNVISEVGDIIVDLDSGDLERGLSISNGTGKARVNGRVVRIGYFGNSQAATLCEQLASLLQNESGVAN